MAEVYPSDNELLNLISESETGTEYIPTGTAPYYLQFRKLLYRLLLATRRANDLRLYDEGGLTFGVKAGKFWDGNTLIEYAGSSGNVLADDKPSIYVYLDNSGALNFNEYSGWPSMASGKHVRLAVITTSGGDITSIIDCRNHHSIAMPQMDRAVVEAHTASDQLEHSEAGSIHTNLGAAGAVTISLPTAVLAGSRFTISVQTPEQVNVDPGNAAIIDVDGFTNGKDKYCSSVGSFMTVVSDSNGNWIVTGKSGVWTEEV